MRVEKVKHETLGNLSDLPRDLIEPMRQRLAQDEPLSGIGEKITIHRSLPHGNVHGVLTTLRRIGMEQLIASRPCRERDLVIAMIADRVIFVGNRGMITSKRIDKDLCGINRLDWISAWRTEGIRSLVEAGKVDRSLFDE